MILEVTAREEERELQEEQEESLTMNSDAEKTVDLSPFKIVFESLGLGSR